LIEPRGGVSDGRAAAAAVTREQARRTALVVASVLLLIAAWNLYRGRPAVVAVFGGLGGALVLAGLFVPAAAGAFHRGWMRFAVALGHVNSRVLLTLVYYLIVTPYGVVSRLAGRDPLRRRGGGAASHWVERKATRQAREQFERLF
jgi:hypothetical protein